MEENIKNLAGAVLVGKSNDDFLLFCKEVLRQYKIEPVICPDVYCAVSKLANSPETVLVTGRISQLAKENGRLIDIAKSQGHVCCCLNDNAIAAKGIDYLISEPDEFLEVVKNLKGQGTLQSAQTDNDFNAKSDFEINDAILEQNNFGRRHGGNLNFNKVDFAPSKAELEALLGGMDI